MDGMKFNLSKDIVFFDIEATGLNVVKDRIIQLAMIKYRPGADEAEEWTSLINPGPVMISEEAYRVHGISAQMVANKPRFEQLADKIWDFRTNKEDKKNLHNNFYPIRDSGSYSLLLSFT